MHRKRVMMRGKNVQNESRLKRTKVRFGETPKPAREPRALPSRRTIPIPIETRSLPAFDSLATLVTLP